MLQTVPLNSAEFEHEAQKILPKAVYGYFAGAAEDEQALSANVQAFRALCFRPRVLVPVGKVSTVLSRTTLKNALNAGCNRQEFSFPVIIAPMAMQRLAQRSVGELGMARAARNFSVPMCLSTLATASIEDIGAVPGVHLFQLYIYKNRSITLNLVRRARAAGFSALVLTVDSPVFGRRERDLRMGFSLPQGITLANFQDSQRSSMDSEEVGSSGLAKYGADLLDPNISWGDVTWLVKEAGIPVWVKGVIRGDDAVRAVDVGVQAIVVSNHGGRQLDSVRPTLEALPEVVAAVGGRIPVLVDSGIRRGGDIAKALALGATAVMVGRPLLWALAVDGQAGVERLLGLLQGELRLTMALLGAQGLRDITRDCIDTYGFARRATGPRMANL